jgi:hypothetical protein
MRVHTAMMLALLVSPPLATAQDSTLEATRQVVRQMLRGISLDSMCACEHVVIDPMVKSTTNAFVTPRAAGQSIFSLTDDDLRLIRGAQTVTRLSAGEWSYFRRGVRDTLVLAVFVVNSPGARANGERTLAVYVIAPRVTTRIWTWKAWRCNEEWRGGPLVVTFEP